jgi:hypothetical protein
MLLNGSYIPHYNDNIAQLTQELRRTQSARFHNTIQVYKDIDNCSHNNTNICFDRTKQTSSQNIYHIYERNVVYADLALTTEDDGSEHKLCFKSNHFGSSVANHNNSHNSHNSHHNSLSRYKVSQKSHNLHNSHNSHNTYNRSHHQTNQCEYAVLTFDSSPSPPSIC